jgi:Hypothetical glycosyl hydrolase family 15
MKARQVASLSILVACGLLALGAQRPSAVPLAATGSAPPVNLPFVICSFSAHSHCLAPSRTPTAATALIFDYNILSSNVKSAESRGHVGYVWGANAPEPQGGSAEHDHYVAWAQGYCPGVGLYAKCPKGGPPSFRWLRSHHPNWILWKADQHGVPMGPARSKSNPGPILDFTNPAVQQYWMDHYIAPYLKQGFDGISWDNPTVYNPYSAVGHYNNQHRFVHQYSGGLQDRGWARAQVQALGRFLRRARAIEPTVRFSLNAPVDCIYAPMAAWHLPLRYIDTVVDEEGYSFWGNGSPNYIPNASGAYCGNRWLDKTNFYIGMEKAGKHLVLINQQPFAVHRYMTDSNPKARTALEWALANYFLVKYSHTYFWFGGEQDYGYPLAEQREELVNLGRPFGDMHTDQGVYVRWFSKGMALVNPNPRASFTVRLHKGKYQDFYGQNVNQVTMWPHSGLLLVVRR